MLRKLLTSLGFVLLVFEVRSASASSPRATGLAGARSSALAGAVSADATDCSASYYNPANLGRGERSQLCLDYSVSVSTFEPSGVSDANATVHTVGGGLVSRGELFGVPFGVGAMLTLPGAKLSRFEAVAADDSSWVLETNRPRVSFSSVGFGVEPWPGVSFGAALHVLAGVRGRFDVGGSLAQPNAYDSELRHGVDADLASSRSFAVGLELRPNEVWELGLVYRHRASVEQDIDGELAGTLGTVPAQYRVDTVVTPAAYPSLLVLGAGYELGALGFFAELAWEDFSEWPEPDTASTNSLTLAGVPLDLTTGPPPGRAQASPHDRLVPRVGVEYELVDRAETSLWLRAGYVFERSPLPAQRTTRWLDADRHTVTLGAGIETDLGEGTTLIADAFGLATLLPERKAVENAPEGGGRASGTQFVSGASVGLGF